MKILIVDDSTVMRRIVHRSLRQAGLGKINVSEAADGQQALDAIASDKPDFVLCDWNMPGMKGIEMLEKLRASGDTTKLGFITSEASDAMRQRAKDAGAEFLLAKPFTPDDVGRAMSKFV